MSDFKRYSIKSFLWLIAIFFIVEKVYGNTLPLERITDINYSITAIEEDEDGVLWLGTWSGLIKYDGQSIETFKPDVSDPDSFKARKITQITNSQNKEGLWISTRDNGLHFYNKLTQQFNSINEKLNIDSISNINTFCFDNDGNIWTGGYNGLHCVKNPLDKNPIVKSISKLSNIQINSIICDWNNCLWLGTNQGILRLRINKNGEPQDIQILKETGENFKQEYIHKLSIENTNSSSFLIIASKDGIRKYQVSNIPEFDSEQVNLTNPILLSNFNKHSSLKPDFWYLKNSSSYYIIWNKSIYKHNQNDFFSEVFPVETTNILKGINVIFQSSGNIIWMGTDNGLYKINSQTPLFRLYQNSLNQLTKSDELQINCIQQHLNKLYLGSSTNGLIIGNLNNKTIESFYLPQYLSQRINSVYSLFKDSKNRLWIATKNQGVFISYLNKSSDPPMVIQANDAFSEKTATNLFTSYCFAELPNHHILAGTYNQGIIHLDENGNFINQFTDFKTSTTHQIVPIIKILPESNNKIWVGTGGDGLLKMDLDADKPIIEKYQLSLKDSNSISDNFITDIVSDALGGLWIGTENGLNLFDRRSKKFINIFEKEGLPSNNINGLVIDDYGTVWASTSNGIAEINPALITSFDYFNRGIKAHSIDDKWPGNFLPRQSSFKTSDGQLLFGSSKTLISHIPKSNIDSIITESKLVIKKLFLNNQQILPQKEYNGRVVLNTNINTQNKIILKPNNSDITVEFGVVSYTSNERTRYAYRLRGLHDNWYYTDSSNPFATYKFLPAGTMTLEVKATNPNGTWGETTRSLVIEKEKSFWKTTFAITVYFLIIVLLVFMIIGFFKKQYKIKTAINIEKNKREQLEESFQDKLKFFTNISHELKSPLSLIIGPILDSLKSESIHSSVKTKLSLAYRNATRLQELVDQILEFRKSEVSHLKLMVEEISIPDFLQKVNHDLFYLAKQKNIEFTMQNSSAIQTAWMDADKIKKVIYNLLSNAIKYTQSGGSVTLICKDADNAENNKDSKLIFEVQDTGIGIPHDLISKVFERFYQVDAQSGGFGIGLALTKNLLTIHKGGINIDSNQGKGTNIKFWIPVDENNYTEAEKKTSSDIKFDITISPTANEYTTPLQQDTNSNRPVLLIVDDEIEMNDYIKSLFFNDFIVHQAYNVKEALDIIETIKPAIVISDLMMPEIDGIKLIELLKQNIKTKDIPLIMLTANADKEKQKEVINLGGSLFINKPFDPDLLKIQTLNLYHQNIELRKQIKTELNIELASQTNKIEAFDDKVMLIIRKNIDNENLNVNKLAELMKVSRGQLNLKIKETMGITAVELIRKTRLQHAAKLITTNQFNISEVAYKSGFSDLKYFRKCFKEEFDVNPSEYKAQET